MALKLIETLPNAIRAARHFKWTELIVSAGAPKIAAKYLKRYPAGRWPTFMTAALWPGDLAIRRRDLMASKMLPELLKSSLSSNMIRHLDNLVEPLRAHLGVPLKVISGWRPYELNRAVGGAIQGSHQMAIATDFKVSRATRDKAKKWAIERQRTHSDIGLYLTYGWGFHLSSRRGFSDGIIK